MLLKNIAFSAVVSDGLIGFPMMAQAGFDWTPPPQKVQELGSATVAASGIAESMTDSGPLTPDPDAVETLPVPVTNVDSQELPPIGILEVEQDTAAPMQTTEDESAPVSLTSEEQELPQPQNTESVSAPPPVADLPVLEGFGKEIPLALALRDIVPSQYAYAFNNSADAGLLVSWRGGKPWQDVLNDALESHNLISAVQDQMLVIGTRQQAAPEVVAPVELEVAEEKQEQKVPVMKSVLKHTWKARPGFTLKEVVEDWSKLAQVEVEWSSPYDYPINNAFSFEGTYDEAIANLLSQYSRETPRPRGRLYPNLPNGPSVLMIN